MINHFNNLVELNGFKFLNSFESIELQENLRKLENHILNNVELEKTFITDIDEYENSMIRNIYSYCRSNNFKSAIFMCGVAHRKSIIEKIAKNFTPENLNVNWVVY